MQNNNKKTIIFLLLFSILFIGITIAAVIYVGRNWTAENSIVIIGEENLEQATNKNNLQVDTFTGETTKLTDTYKNNATTIKNAEYTIGAPLEGSGYTEKIKIVYPEIYNLADSTVRTNINNSIKQKAFSLYKQGEENDATIKRIEIIGKATANYSDVLSVSVEYKKELATGETVTDFTGINYRLENGEEIKFQNLFIVGAGIKNILRQSAYNSFAWEYKKDKITDMREVDYHNLDNQVYQALKDYNNNTNPDFYFTEKEIIVKLNNKPVKIELKNCYEQIAIFEKYVSKNQIYASTSTATDIPILVDRDEYSEMNIYMNIDKNLIIDISLNIENLDTSVSAVKISVENYKKALNDAINILKQDSKNNKNQYVYFISRITAEIDKEQNKLIFKENTYKYIAYSETQFNVYITAPILTTRRESQKTLNKTKYDLNDRNIKIQNLENQVEYDLSTGNIYVEPEPEPEEPEIPEVPQENENTIPDNSVIEHEPENVIENEVPDNVIVHEPEEETTGGETEDDEEGTTVIV